MATYSYTNPYPGMVHWTGPSGIRYDVQSNQTVTDTVSDGGSADLDGTPFNAGNVSGTHVFDHASGIVQKANVTGNLTIAPPNDAAEGHRLELWLTASGADRTLSLNPAIDIPSDSGANFPKTMTSGLTYIIAFKHNGTVWELVSLVGGF